MAGYSSSTQKANWTLPRPRLLDEYHSRNAASATRLAEVAASTSANVNEAVIDLTNDRKRKREDDDEIQLAAGTLSFSRTAYLSVDEEQELISWGIIEILSLCNRAGFDRAVAATAAVFFRRFYLRSKLIEYPPHEMITAAILTAIKAEACPYTEVTPFTRRLAAYDEEAVGMYERLIVETAGSGTAAVSGTGVAPSSSPSSSSSSSATAAAGVVPQSASSSSSPSQSPGGLAPGEAMMLRNEVPLLVGLAFQLTVYHPYRPLKHMLGEAVRSYLHAGGASASTTSVSSSSAVAAAPLLVTIPPSSSSATGAAIAHSSAFLLPSTDADAFTTAWDALQSRALAMVDLSLTTDACMWAAPSRIAAACLLAAADPAFLLLPAPSHAEASAATHTVGDGAADGTNDSGDIITLPSHSLFPALCTPPPAQVAWFIAPFVDALTASGPGAAASATSTTSSGSDATSAAASGTGSGAGVNADQHDPSSPAVIPAVLESLRAAFNSLMSNSTHPTSKLRLLSRLQSLRDPSFCPGPHPAYQSRLAGVLAARQQYKEGKKRRGDAAAAAFDQHQGRKIASLASASSITISMGIE